MSNGGLLPLQVTKGRIDLLLAEDGIRISQSEFADIWLFPGQKRYVSFTHRIEWDPVSWMVKGLIAGSQGRLVVEGRKHFDLRPIPAGPLRMGGSTLIDSAGRRLRELGDRNGP